MLLLTRGQHSVPGEHLNLMAIEMALAMFAGALLQRVLRAQFAVWPPTGERD
jgi:hypothetical protein